MVAYISRSRGLVNPLGKLTLDGIGIKYSIFMTGFMVVVNLWVCIVCLLTSLLHT